MNLHLEWAGSDARLHPDRLMARDLDRTPEPRLRIADSNAYKVRGEVTPLMREVLAHRAARVQHTPTERANALAYWQDRRQILGITRDMLMPERLACVRAAREEAMNDTPGRTRLRALDEHVRTLERSVHELEVYLATCAAVCTA